MRLRCCLMLLLVMPLLAQTSSDRPFLRKQGTATQLIVNGSPFLILGGELHNSSSSSLAYMEPIWQRMIDLNINTVLAGLNWKFRSTPFSALPPTMDPESLSTLDRMNSLAQAAAFASGSNRKCRDRGGPASAKSMKGHSGMENGSQAAD